MLDIDDYNADYFFEGADELEEYNSILDSFDDPIEEEKDFSYTIMLIEQTISTLKELEKKWDDLTVHAANAERALEEFIDVYTEKGVR